MRDAYTASVNLRFWAGERPVNLDTVSRVLKKRWRGVSQTRRAPAHLAAKGRGREVSGASSGEVLIIAGDGVGGVRTVLPFDCDFFTVALSGAPNPTRRADRLSAPGLRSRVQFRTIAPL